MNSQAKAGVITISYYDEAYPQHFRNLCKDAPPLIHVLGNKDLCNREDNVAIIGARAADKDVLDITHPKVNRPLQDKIIAKGGAILSEHPFGVKAIPRG